MECSIENTETCVVALLALLGQRFQWLASNATSQHMRGQRIISVTYMSHLFSWCVAVKRLHPLVSGMQVTIFASKTLPRGLTRDVDLSALLANPPPPPPGGKGDQPLWSAAVFNGTRALKNVVRVSALALDFDDGVEHVSAHLACWGGVHVLWHTSWSHTAEEPRYRLVLPLSRPVSPSEYSRLWLHAQQVHEASGVNVDPSCKDPSRAWFLPAALANYEFGEQGGAPLNVDLLLRFLPEEEAPKAIAAAPTADACWPIVQRAERYLSRMPASISGQHGHDRLFNAAIAMVRGFELPEGTAVTLLEQFNTRCEPRWKTKDLRHKVQDAAKSAVPAGYLLRPQAK